MDQDRTVLAQLLDHLPRHRLRRITARYGGDHGVSRFTTWDHFVTMAFAQLTRRESLRDIEVCLGAVSDKLYRSGLRSGPVARSTLADANERRDWRIFAEFAQTLIQDARRLYVGEPWAVELDQTVYALDASIIDLCLNVFPWARFRSSKAGIKIHTLLDLAGNIPAFLWITDAKTHDVHVLDELLPEPGSIYVMDCGYVDFCRLHRFHRAHAIYITRAKKNLSFRRRYSRAVDRTTGLVCDQTIVFTTKKSAEAYPDPLRRIVYRDPETGKKLTFLTNDFTLPALVVTELYRQRWQVELFFKWIKQHLRIKSFYGTSPNAVYIQIWTAISTYVLVAIVRKRLALDRDLYTLLQILSVALFEKVPLNQALTGSVYTPQDPDVFNQLSLFTL
ncbi:MAG: IS4 family transposase [Dehalococcoidia bacterium]